MENLLTVKELSDKFSLSKSMVYRLVHEGKIKAIRFGNAIRFRPSEVLRYIERLTDESNDQEVSE